MIFIATYPAVACRRQPRRWVAAEYCPAPLRHRLQQIVMRGLTDNILFATFAVDLAVSDQVGLSAGMQKMAASLPESSAA
ncbi:hypothetical protein [Escherichia coli]|uniref:hypothetical protein n=1 Tax=Escherichia coli TaxID=562 RepID=UPI003D9F7CF1